MGWWKGKKRNRIGDGPADRLSAALAAERGRPLVPDIVVAFGNAVRSTLGELHDPEKVATSLIAVLEPGERIEWELDEVAARGVERWRVAIDEAASEYRDALERLPTIAELLETFVFVARGASDDVRLWSLHTSEIDASAELKRCRTQSHKRARPRTARRSQDAAPGAATRQDAFGSIPDVSTAKRAVVCMRKGILDPAFASYSLESVAEREGFEVLRDALEPLDPLDPSIGQEDRPMTAQAMLRVHQLRYLTTRATDLALSEARALAVEDLASQLWSLLQAAFIADRCVRSEGQPSVALEAPVFATSVMELLGILAGDARSGVLGPPSGNAKRDVTLRRGLAFAHACGVWATALLEANPPRQATTVATVAPLLVLARFLVRLAPWGSAIDLGDACHRLHAWTRVDEERVAGVADRAQSLARLISSVEGQLSFSPGSRFAVGQLVRHKTSGVTVVLDHRPPNELVAAFGRWRKDHFTSVPSFLAPVETPPGIDRVLIGRLT